MTTHPPSSPPPVPDVDFEAADEKARQWLAECGGFSSLAMLNLARAYLALRLVPSAPATPADREGMVSEDTKDAERWRTLNRLRSVNGAGWSVQHPREEGGTWYFSFGFPMTTEQVQDAIERGGLGWAPDLETALRNAASAIDAALTTLEGK